MGERRGTKALELWCRRITDGYSGVNVQNMTTSWRDGLAFCAMIHHFRPDLIDFNSLNKDDVYRNNELAFRTAEQHLGIPALLDAEDMASCTVPDRLSILTYLSQFYQTFGASSPSRLATNRTTESSDDRIAPVPESPKQKVGSRLGMRRDPCAACGLPVFLAEKLMIARAPYHRTCFRCARCSNQLTPGNYYETEEGQYCCETCPDEEESASVRHKYTEPTVLLSGTKWEKDESSRPFCDEEKTERKNLLENADVPDLISHTSQMRKSFMASHLLSEKIDGEESVVKNTKDVKVDYRKEAESRIDSAFPDDDENEEVDDEVEEESRSSATDSVDVGDASVERHDVHSALNSLNIKSDVDQRSTAISFRADKNRRWENTKESPGRTGEQTNPEARLSLIQRRLQMFETPDKRGKFPDHTERKVSSNTERSTIQETQEELCDTWVLATDENEHSEKSLEDNSVTKNIDKRKDKFENVKQRKEEEEELKLTSIERKAKESFSKNVAWMNNEERLNVQLDENSTASTEIQKDSFVKIENERRKANEVDEEHVGSSILTAKGIDLSDDYPEHLNPFNSDDEDSVVEDKLQTPMEISRSSKVSTNPFDSEDEDIEQPEPPKPAVRSRFENRETVTPVAKRVLAAPQINLNPFWSDEEEERDSEEEERGRTPQGNVPVPKPRTIKTTPDVSAASRRVDLSRGSIYASNSSLTSSESTTTTPGGTYRKKKPAPQPPATKELFPSDQRESSVSKYNSTPPMYQISSPRTTPRARKAKPAPPPPMPTSTPCNVPIGSALSLDESPIIELRRTDDDHGLNMWEDQKTNKDEANRNRQSLSNVSGVDELSYKAYADKSVQGKWKRKKGPAPPRPIPHRRKIKVISMKDVKLELDEIELQQQGLERQGVRLEQLIRDKCESESRIDDSSLGADVEELVLELFTLVNEKNELFRRQAELMLLRRQQRLEEEHAEVEYQIRCLMCQPEATKTDFDKQKEEALIQRLVEIVERRNEIVECLEMDRRREVEEDKSINKHMGLFVARNKNELSDKDNDSCDTGKMKKGKVKEKLKEKRSKKAAKKDADKDVDEAEVKQKRHNKRKWF
ncbi:MICAL-like protein [Ooceraea biroi]|uniref:MICAL-like protein n=2 Tax=Ooceraea biroi TaxID=2015173 RepID=A0A026WAA7_OOCBI|nr:MICAL-like protein [Ooceraea biroi]